MAKKAFYGFQVAVSALVWPFFRFQDRYFSPNHARILLYHSIADFPPEKEVPYDNVPPELFRSHMRILKKSGFHVIALSDLISMIDISGSIPPRTIAITFDDGYENNFVNALPILKEMGFTATFFLIADAIGTKMPFEHLLWDDLIKKFYESCPGSRLPLTWEEAKALLSQGHEIGSHGLSHRSLGYLSLKELYKELLQSKTILSEATDTNIHLFSYPFGSRSYNDFTQTTKKIAKDAGYSCACTTEIGSVKAGSDVFELCRIPIRETDGKWSFKQKIVGSFDWVNIFRVIFQRNVRRLDKTM